MNAFVKMVLLFLWPSYLIAQQDTTWGYINKNQADSLRILLVNTQDDTVKMSACRLLGFYYQEFKADSSLYYHEQQLELSKKLNIKLWQADAYQQRGYIFDIMGNYPKSFESFSEALKIAGDSANELSNWQVWKFSNARNFHESRLAILAMTYHDMGNLYGSVGEIEKQKSYYQELIKIGESIQNGKILSIGYMSIAGFYPPDSSVMFNKKALYYSNECGYKKFNGSIYGSIATEFFKQINMDSAKAYAYKSINANLEQDNQIGLVYAYLGTAYLYQYLNNKDSCFYFSLKAFETAKLIGSSNELLSAYFLMSDMYEFTNKIDSAYKYEELAGDLNDSLKNLKISKLSEYQKLTFKDQLRLQELENEQVLVAARTRTYALLAGLGVFLIIGVQLYRNNRQKQKSNKELAEKNELITVEKQRSDELLLNILPSEVADEIKQHGYSKAKTYSMVTVMFTDFKDFSSVSEKISGELLVDEINYCFSAFDNIVQKYRVEKIKTVGDAYICVGGMPALNFTHATDIIHAAIEIRNFMLNRKKEKEEKGEIPFELRIGIHTGPVVAGIVGVKKYAYDIWGDTVNLAARMEQNSEAGKINISGNTYELVKGKFTCIHRGKIDAKNKGEVDMYFVET